MTSVSGLRESVFFHSDDLCFSLSVGISFDDGEEPVSISIAMQIDPEYHWLLCDTDRLHQVAVSSGCIDGVFFVDWFLFSLSELNLVKGAAAVVIESDETAQKVSAHWECVF